MTEVDDKLSSARLGERIKQIRRDKALTLSEVEQRCGLRASTVSKIERGAISPSYASLLRLAKGLEVEPAELIQPQVDALPKTRRSITRNGEGIGHSIGSHDYRFLCSELTNKKMCPMIATVHAKEMTEIRGTSARADGLFSHEGEETLFVVKGQVVLHTEFYSPVVLNEGDCAYIDSSMGHACLKGSEEDAVVFWVCTDLAFKPSEWNN
ncbi:helix-turn-helix domain-containing protein [Salinicola lusitanus]|uniref:helix-turn-helix domain-containing protein n=1 Tax=Salinicola lusitanus TaxID=1949085 RepID=UPI000DA1C40F|nr:XRE family transcriptional regulator [Salinicola lusitanus]